VRLAVFRGGGARSALRTSAHHVAVAMSLVAGVHVPQGFALDQGEPALDRVQFMRLEPAVPVAPLPG